jgi:presenilin-like A22 family membrane protease
VRDDRAYRRSGLNWRLETISWGLFFIMLGGLALAPGNVPQGAWLVGTGIIMLGLNLLRVLLGIRPSTFTVILGAIALISGIGSVYGINIPVWPIIIILIGLAIIVRALGSEGRR